MVERKLKQIIEDINSKKIASSEFLEMSIYDIGELIISNFSQDLILKYLLSIGDVFLKNNDLEKIKTYLNYILSSNISNTIYQEVNFIINLVLAISYIDIGNFDLVDIHFINCYPLTPFITKEMEICSKWIDTEYLFDVNRKLRYEYYKYLSEYLNEVHDLNQLINIILFNNRCNETVQLLRKGCHQEAMNNFLIIFFDEFTFKWDLMSQKRKIFREDVTKNIELQIFDQGTLYHYLGMANLLINDLNNSLAYFDDSLLFRKNNGHILDIIDTLNNIASVLQIQNNNLEAYEVYQKTLKLISDHNLEEQPIIYFNLTKIFQKDFDFKIALNYAEEGLRTSIKLNNRRMMHLAFENLGKTYLYLANTKKAIFYFEESIQIYLENEDLLGISYLYYNLIVLHNIEQNFDKSKLYHNKLGDIFNQGNINSSNIEANYIVSTLDLAYNLKNYYIENNLIERLIEILKLDNLSIEIRKSAYLQLFRLDLIKTDNFIFLNLIDDQLFNNYINQNQNIAITCYIITKLMIYPTDKLDIIKQVKKLKKLAILSESKGIVVNFVKLLKQHSPRPVMKFTNNLLLQEVSFMHYEL